MCDKPSIELLHCVKYFVFSLSLSCSKMQLGTLSGTLCVCCGAITKVAVDRVYVQEYYLNFLGETPLEQRVGPLGLNVEDLKEEGRQSKV
jgi:hypothetical protein